MNLSNENTLKKEKKTKNDSKELHLNEFNKKLDYIINNAFTSFEQNNLKTKFINNINKNDKKQLTISQIEAILNNNDINDNNEKNEIMNIDKEMPIKRLNILKLLDNDSLSEFFAFNQSINANIKYGIEYAEDFNESNLAKESIFNYINDFNKNDKNIEKTKLSNLEEIKELKKNEIDLNFGEEPINIYYKMKTTKKKEMTKI